MPTRTRGPDGTITVNGQVVAQTCQVDGKAFGTADNKVVNLPNVLTTALTTSGNTAGDTTSACPSPAAIPP